MPVDWSDLGDERDDAHMARRARPTPDDPDAVGRDQGNAGGSDSPPGSSPARPDSALNIERAEAYRAAVGAAYRQDAIDHGCARTEKPECETITPAMRRIEAEVLERHVVGLKNHSNERDRPTEAAELESFQCPDATTAAARVGSALAGVSDDLDAG